MQQVHVFLAPAQQHVTPVTTCPSIPPAIAKQQLPSPPPATTKQSISSIPSATTKQSIFYIPSATYTTKQSTSSITSTKQQQSSPSSLISFESKDNTFHCSFCSKVYIHRQSLLKHVRTAHTNQQPSSSSINCKDLCKIFMQVYSSVMNSFVIVS